MFYRAQDFFVEKQIVCVLDIVCNEKTTREKNTKYTRKSGRVMAHVQCACALCLHIEPLHKNNAHSRETTDEKIMIKYGNLSAARILLKFCVLVMQAAPG